MINGSYFQTSNPLTMSLVAGKTPSYSLIHVSHPIHFVTNLKFVWGVGDCGGGVGGGCNGGGGDDGDGSVGGGDGGSGDGGENV